MKWLGWPAGWVVFAICMPVWAQTQTTDLTTTEALEARVQALEAGGGNGGGDGDGGHRHSALEAELRELRRLLETHDHKNGGGEKPPIPPGPGPGPELPAEPTESEVTAYATGGATRTFGTGRSAHGNAIAWLNENGGGQINIPVNSGGYDGQTDKDGVRHNTVINCASGVEINQQDQLKDQKGVWTPKGDADLTVIRCQCTNAHSSSDNGACVRNESNGKVWLRSVLFAGGENGFLGQSNHRPDAEVLIEDSVFRCNGRRDSGRVHQIYTGGSGKLTIRRSWFYGVISAGHQVKSYSRDNLIEDSILGGQHGPNGERADCIKDGGGASNVIDMTGNPSHYKTQTLTVRDSTLIHDDSNNQYRMLNVNTGSQARRPGQVWLAERVTFRNLRGDRDVAAARLVESNPDCQGTEAECVGHVTFRDVTFEGIDREKPCYDAQYCRLESVTWPDE